MLKQSAEACGGAFTITCQPGAGTRVVATFDLRHIDCIPMGDMSDTLFTLVFLNPDHPDFLFSASGPGAQALFDTREVREALGGVALNEPDVAQWMKESIDEEFKPILEV